MRAHPALLALLVAAGPAQSQPANDRARSLDLCLQRAHAEDQACEKLKGDTLQQLECWRKSQATQFECLEHVLSRYGSDASAGSQSGAARPSPAENAPAKSDEPAADKRDDRRQDVATQSSPDELQTERKEKVEWLLSETSSPIDYSPIIDAEMRPIVRTEDGPDALIVRCRARRIEVVIRRSRAWPGASGQGLQVSYQIDQRPAVRDAWILAPDRKIAKKANGAEFLQAVPDGAALRIAVGDQADAPSASFRLDGLSAIRPRVARACEQTPETSKTSSSKR